MARLRIVVSIVVVAVALFLTGQQALLAQGKTIGINKLISPSLKSNHVSPGQHARDLMNSQPVPSTSKEGIKQLIRLLHDPDHFVHINREYLREFAKPNFSLMFFKLNLSWEIAKLKLQGGGPEKRKELDKLKRDYDGLDTMYEAFVLGYSDHVREDWPFCLSGEEYVKYDVIDGCTSFAKTFITLANAANRFDDVRLIITKSYEDLQANINLLGTNTLPQDTEIISGHQMVLVKDGNAWYLVNVTFYRSGQRTGVERFEILDRIDGKPIDPNTALHKLIILESEQGELHRLVVAGVGADRWDDLGVHSWADSILLALSIPLHVVEKL